jgi:hypothetical protein
MAYQHPSRSLVQHSLFIFIYEWSGKVAQPAHEKHIHLGPVRILTWAAICVSSACVEDTQLQAKGLLFVHGPYASADV